MALITLTTDWGTDTFYAGSVKGMILNHNPKAVIVDITHQVQPFNMAQAAFILRNSFKYYPKGTIHIIDVNSEASEQIAHIAFSYKNHFFLGTDNGSFGLILEDDEPEKIIKLENTSNNETFSALNIFAPVAALLSINGKIDDLGIPLHKIHKNIPLHPTIQESVIAGTVIYIDSYQNAITNISKELFERIGKGRNFEILVQSYHYKINRINITYNETSSGELLALFNSSNLLEIAINRGKVAELLNLSINSNIRVKFLD